MTLYERLWVWLLRPGNWNDTLAKVVALHVIEATQRGGLRG